MEERSLDEIEKEIRDRMERQEQTYAKAKAEAEVKELSSLSQNSSAVIQVQLNNKLADRIKTSADINNKVDETANKLIEKGLQIQEKQINKDLKAAEKEENQAEFELSEDQYKAFGQSTAPKHTWQKKMIEVGYDFWFCVVYIICFLTLAPFYIFLNVIKNQKGILKFLVISVGVVLLLLCLSGITFGVLHWTGVLKN